MMPKHSSLKNKDILHNPNIIIISTKLMYKPYLNFPNCSLHQDQIECTAFDPFILVNYICILRLFTSSIKSPIKDYMPLAIFHWVYQSILQKKGLFLLCCSLFLSGQSVAVLW